jgi:hypothetical protein
MKELFEISELHLWIRDLNILSELAFKSEMNEISKENLMFKIDSLKEIICKEYSLWQQK